MNRIDKGLLVLAFLFPLLCSSCSTEELYGRHEIELLVTLDPPGYETRVSLDGGSFEKDDEFRIYFNATLPVVTASGSVIISQYKYGASGWAVSPTYTPIYWDDREKGSQVNFCAVMPAAVMPTETPSSTNYVINGDAHSFVVEADQQALAKYKKSDLMIACSSTNTRLVPIAFTHVLSRLVVKFDTPDEGYAFGDITYNAVTLPGFHSTGNITYPGSTPAVTANTTPTADVFMYKGEDGFMAILPPQTIAKDTKLFTVGITTGEVDKIYNYKVNVDGGILLEQGKVTTLTVKLKKTELVLSAVTITDWIPRSADEEENPIKLPD